MKRRTVYVVTRWVEEDDRSTGDPYSRTQYEQKKDSYDDRKKAEKHFRKLKRDRAEDGRRVDNARLESITTKVLESWDDLMDRLKKSAKKRR